MKIHLCGASGEVTGSGYLLVSARATVLVDFGLFQGFGASDAKNRDLGPVDPARLDAVVITHAHLDHVGRLPLLETSASAKAPWKIFGTPATLDLTRIVLEDSARIQESDAEHDARNAAPGETPPPPLYRKEDAARVMTRFTGVPYGEWREIVPGISIRLRDAGHILGSASVEMGVRERDGGPESRIVFGGDIGPRDIPILRDPDPPTEGDLVFLESTYGDRNHRPFSETIEEFQNTIRAASWEKAKVLIPAFAVGRTQLILYELAGLYHGGRCPKVPIWLDSPMGAKATEVYRRHEAILDEEYHRRAANNQLRQDLSELHVIESSAESKTLNDSWEPGIVIAASGMCDGGRIMHHLLHNLWKKGVQVILTGYMGEGTLGRRLVDGAREVRVLGRMVEVRAQVHTLGGLSAHADQSALLGWLGGIARGTPRVVLIHGEDPQRRALAAKIEERYGLKAEIPAARSIVEVA